MKPFIRPNFNIIEENPQKNHCVVAIQPLEKGLGYTIGNSFRRILLSFIPGVAVYGIKIKKVMHEFSTIKGIQEDVPMIILNIKQLVLKVSNIYDYNDYKAIVLHLDNVAGPVYAKDIKCPMGITIENPDLYIATTTKASDLSMEIYVTVDRGYATFADNKALKNGITNFIAIDSDFSPVKNVALKVQPVLIGRTKDLEELILDVTTNGCITAKEAISIASKILISYFDTCVSWTEELENVEMMSKDEHRVEISKPDLTIAELNLSVRAANSLRRHGIETIEDLLNLSKSELMNIKNMGSKTAQEIIRILSEHNLELS